jgi:hypothetical protein
MFVRGQAHATTLSVLRPTGEWSATKIFSSDSEGSAGVIKLTTMMLATPKTNETREHMLKCQPSALQP